MNTDRKYRKYKSITAEQSRKIKGRIINAMVFSLIAFIAVLLITEIA